MTEQELNFLPFNAINEFMRNDYRQSVIRATLTSAPTLPDGLRKPIDHAVKQHVKVPGFRNSEKAPTPIKAIAMGKAFEKNADVVAAVLAGWAASKPELWQQVTKILETNHWQFFPTEFSLETLSPDKLKEWAILPPTADRTRLPGFVTAWPKDASFESLYESFTQTYPDVDESIDNVSLMVVWITMRLPVDVEDAEGGDETEEAQE